MLNASTIKGFEKLFINNPELNNIGKNINYNNGNKSKRISEYALIDFNSNSNEDDNSKLNLNLQLSIYNNKKDLMKK